MGCGPGPGDADGDGVGVGCDGGVGEFEQALTRMATPAMANER